MTNEEKEVMTPVNDANPVADAATVAKLEECMNEGHVKFSFLNARGKLITTTGTFRKDSVPTTRVVDGAQVAKSEDMRVFYDVRHGIYRQFNVNKVVSIINPKVKQGPGGPRKAKKSAEA